MPEVKISTVEQLKDYLKTHLSEARYNHCLMVAKTTEMVLSRYNCKDYVKEWNGFSAGTFVGLAHDLCREMKDEELISYCNENSIPYSDYEKNNPVFLHGYAAAREIAVLCGEIPESWKYAISVHTLGDADMDELALALYISDYIEPSRKYMTQDRREKYLSCPNIRLCAYSVLCDILHHIKEKYNSAVCSNSQRMKDYLEE